MSKGTIDKDPESEAIAYLTRRTLKLLKLIAVVEESTVKQILEKIAMYYAKNKLKWDDTLIKTLLRSRKPENKIKELNNHNKS